MMFSGFQSSSQIFPVFLGKKDGKGKMNLQILRQFLRMKIWLKVTQVLENSIQNHIATVLRVSKGTLKYQINRQDGIKESKILS